ncbi:hypothetical protein FOL47_009409 [Perkinsus chesapeaki]|uniref:RNase H type-1 domain-containing protein n=1 Tax=Perkinsus chesapeaki TaxID=330153 RepID=A0A7J6L8G5_PERCH|nr:hypothetical protein FOL47_009409 [Perkinsus chesapeaki]
MARARLLNSSGRWDMLVRSGSTHVMLVRSGSTHVMLVRSGSTHVIGLTPFRCLQIYEKIFIPRVSYGIEVYGASLCISYLRDFIDTAANTFLRGALRLRRSTPLGYVYILSGYPPLSDILLGKAITIHYHKAFFNDMIGKRAVVKRAKIDKILAAFGFPSDYRGDRLGADPYMSCDLVSRIVIGDDKTSTLEREKQVLTPWKAYTDGSMIRHKSKMVPSVGAAFFIKKEDGASHFEGKRLSTNISIMHAELVAISMCLRWIVDNLSACEVALFSDSRSGLQLLQTCRTSDILNQIRNLDTMCSARGIKVYYYWIAGHSGSEGNEKVDLLANQARSLPCITKLPSSISCTKDYILDYFERSKRERLRRLSGDTAEALATPFQLYNLLKVVHYRSDGGPLCRLLVGHTTALNSYKYRPGHRSYLCDTCMQLDNVRHAVFFCDAEPRASQRPVWVEPLGSFRQLTVSELRIKDMLKFACHLERSVQARN